MKLFGAIDKMSQALTFHRKRHSVLAGNVANVDTPGFKPLDLERPTSAEAPAPVARTQAGHMQVQGAGGDNGVFEATGELTGADGNAVNLERELAKVDANRVRYGATAELVTRRLAILKYAATDGS